MHEELNLLLQQELEDIRLSSERFDRDQDLHRLILQTAGIMAEALQAGRKVITCGNGGSMSDAMHLAEELSGRYRRPRKALAALALSDPGFLTCTANDMGYESVFERGVEALGQPGDVLVALSTSGNSTNVVRACRKARHLNMVVLGLTAGDGGSLARECTYALSVPTSGFADRAQECHIRVIHLWLALIEKALSLSVQ